MIDLPLAYRLETYLWENPRWVPILEICEVFQIDERDLRAADGRRRIHARFAISSTQRGAHGLKHLRHATAAERARFRRRIRNRFAEARQDLDDYTTAIMNLRAGTWPHTLVDGTGNGLLPV